jgi:hypothetical protein
MRSKIRDKRGVTDIGRKSEKLAGLLTFGTGVTRACFQLAGGLPVLSDRLNMCVTIGAIWKEQFRMNQ